MLEYRSSPSQPAPSEPLPNLPTRVLRDDHPSGGSAGPTQEATTFPVLVVDDNPMCQELVSMYLGQDGPSAWAFEFDFAADGAEALAKLSAKKFALVVLDWNLPVQGEGAVLRQLRRSGNTTPVVVISGSDRAELAADLDELDAAFLSKDQMNPDTFELAIAYALGLIGVSQAARV